MAKTVAKSPLLATEVREACGTAASKRLRRAGRIPAVLYGHGKQNVCLSVDRHDFEGMLRHGAHGLLRLRVRGKTQSALIKDLQWDTFSENILHIDFIRVARGETVTVETPITLRGEAPGVNEGGILEQRLYAVELDCPAEAVPEEIQVSINDLHVGEEIKLGDIELPEECHIHVAPHEEEGEGPDPLSQIIVEISRPLEAPEEEEAAPAEPGEPEVISEKKVEDDESS